MFFLPHFKIDKVINNIEWRDLKCIVLPSGFLWRLAVETTICESKN
jgi:hypothetical protein